MEATKMEELVANGIMHKAKIVGSLEYDLSQERPLVWLNLKDDETGKKIRFGGMRISRKRLANFVNKLMRVIGNENEVYYIPQNYEVINKIVAIGTVKSGRKKDPWIIKNADGNFKVIDNIESFLNLL